MDRDRAASLFASVKTRFEKMGFPFEGKPTPLRLVDLGELQSYHPKHHGTHPLLGMARTQTVLRGKREVQRSFLEVLIQYGLPKDHFETVAVHELCHAWLFYQGYPKLPDKVEEGLCSLCEYLWLEKYPSPDAKVRIQRLLENKDPVYGDGLRTAIKALAAVSLHDLFAHVKKHARFPGRLSRLKAGLMSS